MISFSIFFVIIAVARTSKVPALIWSESRSMSDFPQASLGSTIHTKEFTQKYLSPLATEKDGNLVVFLQDKLSLQDITNHADVYSYNGDGGVFKNIKGYMDDHFSVQLPSVSSPGDGIENLKEKFQGKIHEVDDPSEIDNLDFGNGQMNLIIVTLTPVGGASHEEDVFQKNDDSIGHVVHNLKKRNLKYSALYTAKSSVQIDGKSSNLKRHLLEAVTEVDNGTLVNVTNCMYLYFKLLTITVEPNSINHAIVLNHTTNFVDVNSACNNKTAVLNLEYKNADGFDFTIRFDISDHNTTQWNITEAVVTVKGSINGTDIDGKAYMDTSKIWAPKDYSYHCSKLGPIKNFGNDSTVNISMTFDKFQFQPFNIHFNMFSDGWDCMVFFTEAIWMGIFSVFIMILILLYGLSMVADIKTMDKFDDAKGKTITVNVSD